MSTTYGVFAKRVRRLINDLRYSDPIVPDERMLELVGSGMHAFGDRIGYPTGLLTSVAIVAGSSTNPASADYQLATAVQYTQVIYLELVSTGEMLYKRTVDDLESAWGAINISLGTPTECAMWEDTSQRVNVRLRPIPSASDSIRVFGATIPATLSGTASVIPFSEPLLSALAKYVAADCLMSAVPEDLEKLHMDKAVATTFRSDAEAALIADEIRRNRLKRGSRMNLVDV